MADRIGQDGRRQRDNMHDVCVWGLTQGHQMPLQSKLIYSSFRYKIILYYDMIVETRLEFDISGHHVVLYISL